MGDRKIIELEQGWEGMKVGISKLKDILEGSTEQKFVSEEYINLYTTIYNMCTQKPPHDYSAQLYERYREAFNQYITATVLPALRSKHDEFLLHELVNRWRNHKLMIRWLSRFFNYLDRYYINRHSLAPLAEVGLRSFQTLVYSEVKRQIKDAALALVQRERDGEHVDRALLKDVLGIFVEMGGNSDLSCYEADLEEALLKETATFYSRKAAVWIASDSCPEYMLKAEECLKNEKDRVLHYLHSSSEAKLLQEAERELLATHETELLEKEHSGCRALLADDKKEDMARMFRLFSSPRVPGGLLPVAEMFKRHIESEGMALVKQADAAAATRKEQGKKAPVESSETMFVKSTIDLHDKYLLYVNDCFANSSLFHKAVKEAFEIFCNRQVAGSSSAELLASFCDNLLKKGGTDKLSDEAVEETLDKVVRLLAYIADKDLFAEFYRKKLSRRLLFDKCANEEHERVMLQSLKQQFGAQFTSKMEGMVTDLQLARDNQQMFTEWLDNEGAVDKAAVDVSVTVLTTGFWPSYKFVELALPAEMVQGVEVFKKFYETKTKHRKLTWIYALGMCNLTGKFQPRSIELQVTTFQAALLLLFNDDAKLTLEQVTERLHLPAEDTVRALHSLSCAKYKILIKEPAGKAVNPGDVFEFNGKFTDRMRRIRVPMPPVDEKKKVVEDVDKDRRYAIDAAIVRTMKSRKQLPHQQLVLEVVQQLSRMFKPDFKVIKKRIEDLIAREYLERDVDQPNLFRYLA